MTNVTVNRKARRRNRVSKNIQGNKETPRISVYRSNKHIYAQAIDDTARVTLASASSKSVKEKSGKKSEVAASVGEAIGASLLKKGVKRAVFDRSAYAYHGRVKELAEGVRRAGLTV